MRHPRHCKYFEANEFCKQGEGCAYSHRKTVCKSDIESAIQEIDHLKKEVENFKLEMASMIRVTNHEKVL